MNSPSPFSNFAPAAPCGTGRTRALIRWTLLLALFLLFTVSHRDCYGQAAWEFLPYQVRVWVALPDDPTWQAAQFEQLRATLAGRAEATFGPLWSTEVLTAPPAIAGDLRLRMADLTVAQVQAAASLQGIDKIYLVGVNDIDGTLHLQVREFDARARQFGMILDRETLQREALPWVMWDAIARAFTPIAKVERVDGKTIVARIRASGLITTEESPAWIRPGAVLRPVIRRNDRAGEPIKGGISTVPWTLMEVKEQNGSLLTCKLNTGYASPIPAKANARTERLALLVQPQFPSTVLHLSARDASKTPLTGYEVWRKTSETDGELLGATDWRGNIELPAAKASALETLLIKSGGQLLARLPMVPGQQATMDAFVVNDDGRLQAEGFIIALQSKIMDVEARRQITAARIRSKIKEDKLDEARQLLDQFRSYETRSDLNRLIDQQNIKSVDPTTQKRIEKLFSDARGLLQKFISPELAITLQREVQNGKVATAAPPATTSATAPAATTPAAATPATPAPSPGPATTPEATTPMPTPPGTPAAANPFEPAEPAPATPAKPVNPFDP
ncbi:hypothetical protein NA78x_002923 [Anatilimnocola sp. NA78]|uniref:hypothetical protein n=1 Tax=Anatilimnocola sp. NA78 TaxID=3415683 RepID=UPI003CE47D4E